jgi:hypothetical protein
VTGQVFLMCLVLLALLLPLLGAAPADAHPRPGRETERSPLAVRLSSMSPATVPERGAITLTGYVRNVSGEEWSEVSVAPFVSSVPITTRDELAEAAETEEAVAVGDRVLELGIPLGNLAPGAVRRFTLRMPVETLGLTGDPGVYWIGAHALGTSAEGRDAVADGRARTFIPLVTTAAAREVAGGPVPVSVLLPLRERVRRAADGSLERPDRWSRLTGSNGRLARLAAFAATARAGETTWILDPAVLDAIDDYAQGDRPLSLGTPPAEEPERGDDPSASEGEASDAPSPSEDPEQDADGGADGDEELPPGSPDADERAAARAVLEGLVTAARDDRLLHLGYADPDVAALLRRRPALQARAEELAARRLQLRGMSATKAVAPPDGLFDPDLVSELSVDTRLVLSDRGRVTTDPTARTNTGQQVVFTDARASSGGPAPTRPADPLALRQRILAEASLAIYDEAPRPVVVALPNRWDPGPEWQQAAFFDGLRSAPWLRLSSLPPDATAPLETELRYGKEAREAEVLDRNVVATRTLLRTARVLGHLLATENDVTDRLGGAAFTASSYHARSRPRIAAGQVEALDAATRATMDQVHVTGTDLVRLSGGSGVLTMTLVNGMEQPVTVGLAARTTDGVRIETPAPVQMGPGQRATMRLPVTSPAGVHEVTLFPVTEERERVGQEFTFSLRTSQVGQLIWYIMIAGAALLAVMIARRIVLRIRNHRWRDA